MRGCVNPFQETINETKEALRILLKLTAVSQARFSLTTVFCVIVTTRSLRGSWNFATPPPRTPTPL